MPREIEVPLPFRGRSDYQAKGRQAAQTTPRATNVQSFESSTGRLRMASRRGMSKEITTALPGPVQAMAEVVVDIPPFTFDQLGNPSGGSTNPDITVEWDADSETDANALGVVVDFQGNSYTLTADGFVTKRNQAGTEVYSFALPLRSNESVAATIDIDGDEAIYVAAHSSLAGEPARVWRFTKRDPDDGLDQAWEVEIDAQTVRALAWDGSLVHVGVDEVDSTDGSAVVTILGAVVNAPQLGRVVEVPKRIATIAARGGSVYGVCPPESTRGFDLVGNTPFTDSVQDWTPDEAPDADERTHAWMDPGDLGLPELARAPVMIDRRFDQISGLEDTTDRAMLGGLAGFLGENGTGGKAPRFAANAFGVRPGLQFARADGNPNLDIVWWRASGRCLRPNRNTGFQTGEPTHFDHGFLTPGDKVATSTDLPFSRGWYPATLNHSWAMYGVFRFSDTTPEVLWFVSDVLGSNDTYLLQQPPNREHAVALVVNGNGGDPLGASSSAPDRSYGAVTLYVRDNSGATVETTMNALTDGALPSDENNETRMAIIGLVYDSTANTLELRVNGSSAGTAAFNPNNMSSALLMERVGYREMHPAAMQPTPASGTAFNQTDIDIVNRWLPGVDNFSGQLGITHTIFGASSGGVHNVAVTTGVREQMEGYLGHLYGVADILATGHTYRTAPPTGAGGSVGGTVASLTSILNTKDGIGFKIAAGSSGITWAVQGAGVGHSIAVDPNSTALYMTGMSIATDSGNLGPWERTVRKLIDRGNTLDHIEHSQGQFVVIANPADGDAFVVHDGSQATTFTFRTTASVATDIEIQGSASATAQEIAVRMNAAPSFNGAAIFDSSLHADGVTIRIAAMDEPPASYAGTEITYTGSWHRHVFGMDAGARSNARGAWSALAGSAGEPSTIGALGIVDSQGDPHLELTSVKKLDGSDGSVLYEAAAATGQSITGIARSPVKVDWTFMAGVTEGGPELLWVIYTAHANGDQPILRQYRLLGRTVSSGAGQKLERLAVAAGRVFRWHPDVTPLELTGHTLNTTAPWVTVATLFGNVYFSDGEKYLVYEGNSQTLKAWTAEDGGEIPAGCRVLGPFIGRMAAARGAESPHDLYFSKKGNANEWDRAPAVSSAGQALHASDTIADITPDAVTGFLNVQDDIAIVFCSQTAWQVTGDLGAGGATDLVSPKIGMPLGCVPAQDASGRVYFAGHLGGIYVMGGGAAPVELTDDVNLASLRDIDFDKHRVVCVWDEEETSLHVWVVRNDTGAVTPHEHWVFDRRNQAWHSITIDGNDRQPLTSMLMAGTKPSDRGVVLGCEDGFIRRMDADAVSDDGRGVFSELFVGPIRAQGLGEIAVVSTLFELAPGSTLEYEWYDSTDPTDLGRPKSHGRIERGFRGLSRLKARGSYLWLRLFSKDPLASWALEGIVVNVKTTGRRRRGA